MLLADTNARWSYNGARALVEHLEEMEEDCGIEIELDVVAIRCDWRQYTSASEAADEYGWEWDGEAPDMREHDAADWLRQQTIVLDFEGGVIVQLF